MDYPTPFGAKQPCLRFLGGPLRHSEFEPAEEGFPRRPGEPTSVILLSPMTGIVSEYFKLIFHVIGTDCHRICLGIKVYQFCFELWHKVVVRGKRAPGSLPNSDYIQFLISMGKGMCIGSIVRWSLVLALC